MQGALFRCIRCGGRLCASREVGVFVGLDHVELDRSRGGGLYLKKEAEC